MDEKKAAEIYSRYLKGDATPEEIAWLESANLRLAKGQSIPAYDRDEARASIRAKIARRSPLLSPFGGSSRLLPVRRRAFIRYAAAAAVLLVAAVVGYFAVVGQRPAGDRLAAMDIVPGGNRATLTLADGRTIDLSEAQSGIVVGDGVTYLDGSSVLSEQVNMGTSEQAGGTERNHTLTSSPVHVLTTPKGGTYQVTLPDGSNVWLNANSTLKYHSRFPDEERVVELTGEAYFDIREQVSKGKAHTPTSSQVHKLTSSQKTPFKVITNGQTVEVLGTQFNISAYPDEPIVKTTLVEGSVRLRAGATGASVSLVPGEQGLLIDGTIETKQVNMLKYTSWKDGLFYFRDASIDEVVNQLERWYDVAVIYDGDKPTNQFTGEIPRSRNASEVLAMLEYFGVQYRINGKTITLSNNQIK